MSSISLSFWLPCLRCAGASVDLYHFVINSMPVHLTTDWAFWYPASIGQVANNAFSVFVLRFHLVWVSQFSALFARHCAAASPAVLTTALMASARPGTGCPHQPAHSEAAKQPAVHRSLRSLITRIPYLRSEKE